MKYQNEVPFNKDGDMNNLAIYLAELVRQEVEFTVRDTGNQLLVKIVGY